MATIKLKKPAGGVPQQRPPVRGAGAGVRPRPTLAQAQAERARRSEATEAARGPQRAERDERTERGPRPERPRARPEGRGAALPPARPHKPPLPPRPANAAPNTAFAARAKPRPPAAPSTASAPAAAAAHAPGSLRLSKRMSELGLASRREADEWIAKGWVRVDGAVVAELGARVLPEQQVTLDKRARSQQASRITVLLNKPIGYVSGQAEDGYEPASVLIGAAQQWAEDRSGVSWRREHLMYLAPAGRLDIDSTGLLVLTQDGRVAKKLIGADSTIEKEYLVRVEPLEGTPLSEQGLQLLRHGLELDGEALAPARVDWINEDQLRFVLTEGKKRQIRRMCEAVGLKVTGLKRVRIGRVALGDLPLGQWRYLRADETFE